MNDSITSGFITLETKLGRGDQGKSIAKFQKSIFQARFKYFAYVRKRRNGSKV